MNLPVVYMINSLLHHYAELKEMFLELLPAGGCVLQNLTPSFSGMWMSPAMVTITSPQSTLLQSSPAYVYNIFNLNNSLFYF